MIMTNRKQLMIMGIESQISNFKDRAIDDDLLTAMCLLKKVRDILHLNKDSKELRGDQAEELGSIQTELNEYAAYISGVIGSVMYSRVDELIRNENYERD